MTGHTAIRNLVEALPDVSLREWYDTYDNEYLDDDPPIYLIEFGLEGNFLEVEELDGRLHVSDYNSSASSVGPSDDDAPIREIVREWLECVGYEEEGEWDGGDW